MCPPSVLCEVHCVDTECAQTTIDASEATSLVLNCVAGSCEYSDVVCPTADASSCVITCGSTEINGSQPLTCQFMSISAGQEGNTMDTFALNCFGEQCSHVRVILTPARINDVHVNCSGSAAAAPNTGPGPPKPSEACYLVTVDIASDEVGAMDMYCGANTCDKLYLNAVDAAHMGSVSVFCS